MDEKENVIIKFNNTIDKYVKKDRVNHAYLIETNYDNKITLAEELIKKILSFENSITIEELKLNNDLIIIESDTNTIKTEEIENLKDQFITTSLNGTPRIYIINEAEKLNDFASNKLLKFIEEPEENIIAILLTENKNNLLETIISRCQIIRFFLNQNNIKKLERDYIEELFNFVINIEENNEEAIAFQNKYDIKKLSDRKYLQDFLNNILYIYDDVILYKINKTVEYFTTDIDKINKISENNDINDIKRKINAINTCINRIKYNPNTKLLIDKLILLMTGVEENA